MRTKIDWRSSSKENYDKFCKSYPTIKLTYDEWRNILYTFNEFFKEYILETGDKAKLYIKTNDKYQNIYREWKK